MVGSYVGEVRVPYSCHHLGPGYFMADSAQYVMFPSIRGVRPVKSEGVSDQAGRNNGAGEEDKAESASKSRALPQKYRVVDKPKDAWTAEEDLRLLDAIQSWGIGNWSNVAEHVTGGGDGESWGGGVLQRGPRWRRRRGGGEDGQEVHGAVLG